MRVRNIPRYVKDSVKKKHSPSMKRAVKHKSVKSNRFQKNALGKYYQFLLQNENKKLKS